MSNQNKDLYYLSELTDYKVAENYPDVRGWEVRDIDNRIIGKVDNLLVSMSAERVVYLDVEVEDAVIENGHEVYGSSVEGVHEFLNKEGENHLIVPIGMVGIDEENKLVRSDKINHETFAKTRRFASGTNIDREYEIVVYGTYLPDAEKFDADEDSGFYDRDEFKLL